MARGLAGMKFSGSVREVGKKRAIVTRGMRNRMAPNRSLEE